MRLPHRGATAAVAVAAAVLTGCTGDNSGIEVAAVGRSTVTEVVEAPATVQARASTTLAAPAAGEVARVYVKDGERVGAGTLIARISSPETTGRLTQARAALAQAEASTPGAPAFVSVGPVQSQADIAARGAFDGARTAAGLIPDPRLRTAALTQVTAAERQYALAAAQARSAVAAINSGIGNLSAALASLTAAQRVQAQVAVDAAEKAVQALDVRAPIGGTVQLGGTTGGAGTGSTGTTGGGLDSVLGQLPAGVQQQASSALGGAATGGGPPVQTVGPVTEGMPVSTGMTLATIVDDSVLSLVAEVDETDVFLVRPGVRAVAELDAVPGARYGARVAAVDLSPTASARGGVSYRVRLSLAAGTLPDGDPAPKPRPGMSAVADLRVRTARDAVTVPASAVVRDGARDAVWVQDGRMARKRTVTVGTQGEDAVEIRDGVREGERVVVRGADRVREGQELP
ncbi:MAG: efflux RND transporter periplasmic adaptor subunit [Mycobacteriales bacterium]